MQITLTHDQQLCLSSEDHQIIVPPTVVGLRFILQTLRGQAMSVSKLGQPGAPTQWEIDKAVKEWNEKLKEVPNIDVELDL